jgi:hypothetical protein
VTEKLTKEQKALPRTKRKAKSKRAVAAEKAGIKTYFTGAPECEYTDEIGNIICDLVSIHPMSQKEICKRYPEIPSEQTIRRWRFKIPEFGSKYWEAKKIQAVLHEEECEELVKNNAKDFYHNGKSNAPNAVAVARDALILKHMHWHTSRLLPKIFGDKVIEDMRDKIVEQDATIERLNKMLELQKKHDKDY